MQKLSILLFLLAPALFADVTFEPPDPTSRPPVFAVVTGAINACKPETTNVVRTGNDIAITVVIPTGCDVLPAIIPFRINADLGVLAPGVYRVRAMPDRFTMSLGESTLIVQDANPPFTVTPNVGMGGSFDRITLFGNGIASCDDMPICLPPAVKFGNALARVDRIVNPNEIVVEPPRLPPGPVDVTVETGTKTYRHVNGFYYVSATSRPSPAFYEPILFPVVFTGDGAFGSRWETQVSIANENPYPLTMPLGTMWDGLCFPICDSRPAAGLSQTKSGHNFPNGNLMFVSRQAAPNVHFGTLVKDLSRQSEALGTEIPVLREHDLYDRPFELLNVPTDPRFRIALRLYDVESPRLMTLRITKMGSNETLLSVNVQLQGLGPAYFAINDLVGQFPVLRDQGALRVIVQPATMPSPTAVRSMWGFVSITNNTTQHVTVISPQ